jgi:hypothetical protein
MLFDLRSRGRKNVVKGVYSFLAILMGAGLVLFGIGGAVSGGLLNAINGSSGSSGTSPTKTLTHLEQIVRQDPTNAKAWDRLVTVRLNIATAADGNTDVNGGFTAQGKQALGGVASAWTHYLALKPKPLDLTTAQKMEQIYSQQGLNQPAELVKTIEAEIAATKKPDSALYAKYAVYASLANQTRKAALAQSQAESLASAGKTGKAKATAISTIKQQIAAAEASLKGTTATPTATTPAQ